MLDMPAIVHECVIETKYPVEDSWEIPIKELAINDLETMKGTELDRNWKLNDFFGSIYVINLPQAKERLEQIEKELKNIETSSYTVFPGIDGQNEVDPSIWKKFYRNLHHINASSGDSFDRLHQGQAGAYMRSLYESLSCHPRS